MEVPCRVLDIIRECKTISFSQLLESCPLDRVELKKELNTLVQEGKVSKNLIIECPNCATSIGFYRDDALGQQIHCIYCNEGFILDEAYVKAFFFIK